MLTMNERQINILESIKVPNTYWKKRSKAYLYWFRSLLQKVDSSLIFSGIPDGWDDDFFHLCLWARGYVCVFESARKDLEKYGSLLFQPCNIAGFDFYYQPTTAIVANPMYEKTFTIGKDAELLKLTPDFWGIFDIIDFYASKLAELSKGIDMGLINTKFPMILSAVNEAQAATLKKVYDKVEAGEPLVIMKDIEDSDEIIPRKNPFETWGQDFKDTYVVHNLLEDMGLILDSFYCEIGLPVAVEKKERLVTSEADFASAQSQARISCWAETLKESFEKIERHFGVRLEVEVAHEREDNTNGDGDASSGDAEVDS